DLENVWKPGPEVGRVKQFLPVRSPARSHRQRLVVGDLSHLAEEKVADIDLWFSAALTDKGQLRREKAGLISHGAHREVRRTEQRVPRRTAGDGLAEDRSARRTGDVDLDLVGGSPRGKRDFIGVTLRLPAKRAVCVKRLIGEGIDLLGRAGDEDRG